MITEIPSALIALIRNVKKKANKFPAAPAIEIGGSFHKISLSFRLLSGSSIQILPAHLPLSKAGRATAGTLLFGIHNFYTEQLLGAFLHAVGPDIHVSFLPLRRRMGKALILYLP